MGQLLGTLDELQLSDHTMVVLVGDQGSMLGEHALYDKGPYCYDELMRIPLLIRVPGARPGTVDRVVIAAASFWRSSWVTTTRENTISRSA